MFFLLYFACFPILGLDHLFSSVTLCALAFCIYLLSFILGLDHLFSSVTLCALAFCIYLLSLILGLDHLFSCVTLCALAFCIYLLFFHSRPRLAFIWCWPLIINLLCALFVSLIFPFRSTTFSLFAFLSLTDS